MHFTLTIDCNKAAFTRVTNDEENGMSDAAPEVARLLQKTGATLGRLTTPVQAGDEWAIVDSNGAVVGTAFFTESD